MGRPLIAAAGLAVVLISSELNELAGMADRVLVMSQGRIEAEMTEGFDEVSAAGATVAAGEGR